MQNARAGCKGVELSGGPIVETRTGHDQQIAFLHGMIGGGIAVHAQHAHVEGCIGIHRAQSFQRVDRRQAGRAHQGSQRALGFGHADAATDVQQGPLGGGEQGTRAHQAIRFTAPVGARLEAGRTGLRTGQRNILGQVDQHRSRPTGTRNRERLAHRGIDVLGAAHDVAVLHHRQAHAEHIHFLEGIGSHHRRLYLAGDGHHRHGIEKGIGDAGQQVGRARARGCKADADLAGRACVTIGRECGALFMAHQDVPDGAVNECVVHGHHRAAGVAEHHLAAFFFKRLQQPLRASADPG